MFEIPTIEDVPAGLERYVMVWSRKSSLPVLAEFVLHEGKVYGPEFPQDMKHIPELEGAISQSAAFKMGALLERLRGSVDLLGPNAAQFVTPKHYDNWGKALAVLLNATHDWADPMEYIGGFVASIDDLNEMSMSEWVDAAERNMQRSADLAVWDMPADPSLEPTMERSREADDPRHRVE